VNKRYIGSGARCNSAAKEPQIAPTENSYRSYSVGAKFLWDGLQSVQPSTSVVHNHSVHSVGEALCGLPQLAVPHPGCGGPRRVPPTGSVVAVFFLNRGGLLSLRNTRNHTKLTS
jgi:hypothetical protein